MGTLGFMKKFKLFYPNGSSFYVIFYNVAVKHVNDRLSFANDNKAFVEIHWHMRSAFINNNKETVLTLFSLH